MIAQTYFLSILYLLLGASLLLADFWGMRFPLLLSLRYAFRVHKLVRRAFILSGLGICLALGFFPYPPGPALLGDFVPLLNCFCLLVYYLYQSLRGMDKHTESEQTVLDTTGLYMERNKRNFGYLTLAVAVLHFLAPQLVLL